MRTVQRSRTRCLGGEAHLKLSVPWPRAGDSKMSFDGGVSKSWGIVCLVGISDAGDTCSAAYDGDGAGVMVKV